jgi:hypothetical protein
VCPYLEVILYDYSWFHCPWVFRYISILATIISFYFLLSSDLTFFNLIMSGFFCLSVSLRLAFLTSACSFVDCKVSRGLWMFLFEFSQAIIHAIQTFFPPISHSWDVNLCAFCRNGIDILVLKSSTFRLALNCASDLLWIPSEMDWKVSPKSHLVTFSSIWFQEYSFVFPRILLESVGHWVIGQWKLPWC